MVTITNVADAESKDEQLTRQSGIPAFQLLWTVYTGMEEQVCADMHPSQL